MDENLNSNNDLLSSFIFDELPIRGVIVKLDQVIKTIFSTQTYPPIIQQLLSEALIAVVMLFSLSKESGKMTLQFQSENEKNPIKLLSVRCTFDRKLRALAQWNTPLDNSASFSDLMGHGQLVMTYQSDSSLDQFQSMIPLTGNSLSDSVEAYFTQSDQLKTYLKISSGNQEQDQPQIASGIMLQVMPELSNQADKQEESFIHVTTLAKTLTDLELLKDSPETILIKLFSQDQVRVFEPRELYFGCGCSLEKMQDAIRSMGKTEALKILEEEGYLEVKCEFCQTQFSFAQNEVEKLFS